MGQYRIAQICANGHVITDAADAHPELRSPFCTECGSATITTCPSCNVPIRGEYFVSGVISGGFGFTSPRHCHSCGKPYPWTVARLIAARDLADEIESLSSIDRELLKKSLVELASESPQTDVAAVRVKRILKGAGGAAVEALRKVLVDVLSEAAKKSMGL